MMFINTQFIRVSIKKAHQALTEQSSLDLITSEYSKYPLYSNPAVNECWCSKYVP